MQISGGFNQYLINNKLNSCKHNASSEKQSIPNTLRKNSPFSEYVNAYAISFLAKPSLTFTVERTANAANIPKKYKITDKHAKKLILAAQAKAKKNKNVDYSGASHGVSALVSGISKIKGMLSDNYKIISECNSEISRARTFCGESKIITHLLDNNILKKLRAIAISRPNITGQEGDSVTPCSNCCALFKDIYKSKKVKKFKYVQYVIPEGREGNKIKLKIMTLKDLLPQIDDKTPSLSKKNIGKLFDKEIDLSDSVKRKEIEVLSETEIKRLLKNAKKAYKENNENASAAVLTESGKIFTGCKMGPKARMSISADITALQRASSKSKIKALAIFEKDNTLPSIENLSWFLHPQYVTDDFQIIVIKNDKISIRTVDDYMPYAHKCNKTHSSCFCNNKH